MINKMFIKIGLLVLFVGCNLNAVTVAVDWASKWPVTFFNPYAPQEIKNIDVVWIKYEHYSAPILACLMGSPDDKAVYAVPVMPMRGTFFVSKIKINVVALPYGFAFYKGFDVGMVAQRIAGDPNEYAAFHMKYYQATNDPKIFRPRESAAEIQYYIGTEACYRKLYKISYDCYTTEKPIDFSRDDTPKSFGPFTVKTEICRLR